MVAVRRFALVVLVVAVTGCSAAAVPASSPAPSTPVPSIPAPTPPAPTSSTPAATTTAAEPVSTAATDPALREELLAMLAADQESRADPDGGDVNGDRARTERLRRITAERGWPGRTLVGDDGATAAWAIAQHSDLDEGFQREALELMRQAVAVGEADPGELAYLVDRVAANAGQPQTYGTQMGCTPEGEPQLAPLAEPDRVDELRAEAGLQPLEEYLAELAEVCAQS